MVIWKFQLGVTDHQILPMPTGARILTVQHQYEELVLWALCDPTALIAPRPFRILGTGHPLDKSELDTLTYIGTVQQRVGTLVWHVFEVTQP